MLSGNKRLIIYQSILSFFIFSIWGCVPFSPGTKNVPALEVSQQQQLNYEGNIALKTQNYQLALDRYQASLTEAQKAGDGQYSAIAMYGLARTNGYLCNFKAAEEWFQKSILLRETLPDESGAKLSQNIFELARLYVSAKEWNKAKAQFERAFPLVEDHIEKTNPLGYTDALELYLKTLVSVRDSRDVDKIKQKIEELRKSHSPSPPGFKIQPYPTDCANKK
jgi:tetratricopeptide (TPR) repeat protein